MRSLNMALAGALIAGVSIARRAQRLTASASSRPPICGAIKIIAGTRMAGTAPGGISAAMRGARIMVGAVLMAGMDGLPRCGDIAWACMGTT